MTAIVYPTPGREKATAQALLALAKDPMEVRTTHEDRLAFLVPDELYERYLGAVSTPADEPPVLTQEQERRRPGRPRKAVAAKESDD